MSALALFSIAVLAAAQEVETEVRTYDLRPVLVAQDGQHFQRRLSNVAILESDVNAPGVPRRDTGPGAILELVTQLEGGQFEYAGRELRVIGADRAVIVAPAPIHDRTRAALDVLRETIAAPIELELTTVRVTPGSRIRWTGGAIVPAAEAESWLEAVRAQGAEVREQAIRLVSSRIGGLDATSAHDFLSDYDVEISQGSFAFDPVSGRTSLGDAVFARAVRAPEGLFLSLLLERGAWESPPEGSAHWMGGATGGEELASTPQKHERRLELVAVRGSRLGLNTFLPDGDALVASSTVAPGGEGGREILVVRAPAGGPEGAALRREDLGVRELWLIDSELFHPPSFRWFERGFRVQGSSIGPDGHAGMSVDEARFAFDMLDRGSVYWRALGPWLWAAVAPDDSGAHERTWADVRALIAPRATVEVELGLLSGGSTELAAVTVPVRVGTPAFGTLGIERTTVSDYDVEVATFASVVDPDVSREFEGLAYEVTVSSDAAGSVTIDLFAVANVRSAPIESFETGDWLCERIDQSAFDRLVVDERVVFGEGGSAERTARFGSDAGPLRLELTVR